MSRRTIAYQPALDGLRAVAVVAVLLFHGGISWMGGGYLGVSVFFTLSGFLITSLMLVEAESSGTVDVRAFYARRARRLLPASLVCLTAVCVMAWGGWFRGVANLRRDVLGALLQVFNWVKLGAGESYADLTTAQSGFRKPLDHYWSLAIEEQFYWIWPLAFLGVLALARQRRSTPLRLVTALALLSAIAAPLIARWWGPDAAYWSTPARMSEILAGALAACWVAGRVLPPWWRLLAPLALAALIGACMLFPDGRGPAYEGALPLVAATSAAMIIGVQIDGPARRLLSVRPLVAVGKVSYGVYLYHWPVFVIVDRQGWDLPLAGSLALKCAVTAVVATVSYVVVERPVRLATWLPPRRTLQFALSGSAVVAALVVIVPSPAKYYGIDAAAAQQAAIDTGPVAPLVTTTSTPAPTTGPSSTAAVATTSTTASTTPVPPRPVRIVVIGDSTAEATGAGLLQWAAGNPALAQVELATGPGCGLALGGFLVFNDSERNVDDSCAPYVRDIVLDRVAELRPDVVMLMTTTWDVADRRLVRGGPVLSSADPDAKASIAASFGELTDHLLALGVSRVVWVREPVPVTGLLGPADRQGDLSRHEALYDIMGDLAAANPAVRVVDLAGWVDQEQLTSDTSARPDAVHWTPEASLRIAAEFLGPALVSEALT